MLNKLQKKLIIGPAWVGDMIMAQTLFKLLKKREHCQIDVLAPKVTLPLLDHMPEITHAIELPLGHGQLNLITRYKLAKKLQQEDYQQAIILPNSWKSTLIPFLTNIPKRTGWLGEWRYGLLNDIRKLDKKRYPLMIERFMALGLEPNSHLPKTYDHPELVVNTDTIIQTQQRLQLETHKPILVFCPGAEYGPAKRWPAHHFAEIAKQKVREGWDIWIIGSAKETPIAKAIQNTCDHCCIDLTGKTSLEEAITLISLCQGVITNDSGLMHVAASLKKPIVAIYGSSSPQFTPPLHNHVKIESLNLNCSPCFKRECPLQHMKCLNELYPTQIISALDQLLAEQSDACITR